MTTQTLDPVLSRELLERQPKKVLVEAVMMLEDLIRLEPTPAAGVYLHELREILERP